MLRGHEICYDDSGSLNLDNITEKKKRELIASYWDDLIAYLYMYTHLMQ